MFVFVFKQKTAYEMRISDWSSDVCSSDLSRRRQLMEAVNDFPFWLRAQHLLNFILIGMLLRSGIEILSSLPRLWWRQDCAPGTEWLKFTKRELPKAEGRSEEHTSELQSLMRTSSAVICLKQKTNKSQ